jgi:hypothetical protein
MKGSPVGAKTNRKIAAIATASLGEELPVKS